MAFATYLIKIKGCFNIEKWTEEEIKEYIKKKIKEIESFYHTDLELLLVEDGVVEVWVFISALPSEATEDIIRKWLNNHIKEDGITVSKFEVLPVANFLDSIDKDKKQNFLILLS